MILKEFIRAVLSEGSVIGPRVTDAEKKSIPALQRNGTMDQQVLRLGARYERIWISDPSGRVNPETGKPARFPVDKKIVDTYIWLERDPMTQKFDPAWYKRYETGDDSAADKISPLTPSQKIQDKRQAQVAAAAEERARKAPATVVRLRRNKETGEEVSLTPVRRG